MPPYSPWRARQRTGANVDRVDAEARRGHAGIEQGYGDRIGFEAVVVPETLFFRHREALLVLARFAAERANAEGTRTLLPLLPGG
ncbi:hypothetical protein OOOCML_32900 (plasmid) [Cupriavidus necator H16]|uniref:Uncharacterized protein n=1 Tax=Cupriavidus necator (strain ATCC 17699 / DSM 428 / KCTC 22496 / NCIMB 10442 / H16 / Stanier 337) TaxID=381666 RepID=Q7WXK7_CUPNH|nr:hypothetical protein PHG117 [Cupriavidus necator H16]